jgi:sulfhydrogenase subunit delta
MPAKPRLAVFKFASCDGCQLQLLGLRQRLLALADVVEIAHFPAASSRSLAGPYDIGLVEGSISVAGDWERIREIRSACRFLAAIGACATAGGIQALRNWSAAGTIPANVHASPDVVRSLAHSTPIGAHVPLDFELRGCPVDAGQLEELIAAAAAGRKPRIPRESVCFECKAAGTVCVAVTAGVACLGPVTQAGCGAICPAHGRPCYGCFGPVADANLVPLIGRCEAGGTTRPELVRLVRSFNPCAPEFRAAGDRLSGDGAGGGDDGNA